MAFSYSSGQSQTRSSTATATGILLPPLRFLPPRLLPTILTSRLFSRNTSFLRGYKVLRFYCSRAGNNFPNVFIHDSSQVRLIGGNVNYLRSTSRKLWAKLRISTIFSRNKGIHGVKSVATTWREMLVIYIITSIYYFCEFDDSPVKFNDEQTNKKST